ncbi:hypothetical protein Taro_022276, partial [Colocasia esculenta]|nr:hypothetical protein [Colocasia esculenta]
MPHLFIRDKGKKPVMSIFDFPLPLDLNPPPLLDDESKHIPCPQGKGWEVMAKIGYIHGRGLGRNEQGPVHSVHTRRLLDRAGLGFHTDLINLDPFIPHHPLTWALKEHFIQGPLQPGTWEPVECEVSVEFPSSVDSLPIGPRPMLSSLKSLSRPSSGTSPVHSFVHSPVHRGLDPSLDSDLESGLESGLGVEDSSSSEPCVRKEKGRQVRARYVMALAKRYKHFYAKDESTHLSMVSTHQHIFKGKMCKNVETVLTHVKSVSTRVTVFQKSSLPRSTHSQSRSTLDPVSRTASLKNWVSRSTHSQSRASKKLLAAKKSSCLLPLLSKCFQKTNSHQFKLKEREEVIQTFKKGQDNIEAFLGSNMTTTSHGLGFNKKKPQKDKSGEKKGKAPLINFVKGPNLENTEIQQTANKTPNKTQNKSKTQKQKKTIRSTQSPDRSTPVRKKETSVAVVSTPVQERSTCSTPKTKNSNKNLKNKKKGKEIIHEKPWTSKTTLQEDWINPWNQ